MNSQLYNTLCDTLKLQVPRVLTQLDRDQDSPTFGCFDRDYWHYKIRDFPSMILQQGNLVLDVLYRKRLFDELSGNDLLLSWMSGGLDFWAARQLRNGAFDEYYPNESGYPPTAFSLYAVCLLLGQNPHMTHDPAVRQAMQAACVWLLANPEREASNQQIVGLTAVYLASRLGATVDEARLAVRFDEFFSSQSGEGWFPEYGGPDLGYLSVSMDALWDYHAASGDERALAALDRACLFMSSFINADGTLPVMINSRNTDYVVPYGLVRYGSVSPLASAVVHALYSACGSPYHFLHATDDRYACHYIFQSCFRALEHIQDLLPPSRLPSAGKSAVWLPQSGLFIAHSGEARSLYIATRKGGVCYLFGPSGLDFADFGYRCTSLRSGVAVTHWQNDGYTVEMSQNEGEVRLNISGEMPLRSWLVSSPLKHVLLRLISFLSGRRIVPLLKSLMIFGKRTSGVCFSRHIRIGFDELVITDDLTALPPGLTVRRAPQYSLRHVASAFRFTWEELAAQNAGESVRTAEAISTRVSWRTP
ncbi:MAG: hypothetical protein KKA55_03630 [Proteobacteria bacterium]|nr:hypothetical protein [Pseudomonadota bacterium]MBU1594603.1 hypothetical protein [Pseudomonadota bacterium]